MAKKEPVAPHDLDAERAVLGAVLIAPQAWPRAEAQLRSTDFFRVAHQQVYEAMHALASGGTEIDFITLKDELSRAGRLEEVGGPAYLSGLTDGVPRSANVEHYAGIVREKARLRALIASATDLIDAATTEGAPAARLLDTFTKRALRALGVVRHSALTAAEAVANYITGLNTGTARQPIPTGYADLDRLIDGVNPRDLVIVAARPSTGKTSFALGIAVNISRSAGGKAVPFFSLEMDHDGIAARLISWHANVPIALAVKGEATMEQYAAIADAPTGYAGAPVRIETTAHTLSELDAWCRIIEHEQGLAAVVVDYIQLLVPEESRSSTEAEIAAISRGLLRLAKDLGVPVVALSQLSRAPEGRADKRPQSSDLRGSGALEQDACLVILIHRPEMYQRTPENEGIAEVIVSKNRAGPVGIVRLHFDKAVARFRDLSPRDVAYEQEAS